MSDIQRMTCEDCIALLLCVLLFPLYPLFYFLDCFFDTGIMYDGSSLHEPPSPYLDELEEREAKE